MAESDPLFYVEMELGKYRKCTRNALETTLQERTGTLAGNELEHSTEPNWALHRKPTGNPLESELPLDSKREAH